MDCPVDFSPGEDWIGYIRMGLWTDLLIDATLVTGSLLDSALSDCLIELCTAGFSSTWTFCSTDSVLLAGLVLSVRRVNNVVNMAADDGSESWCYVWCGILCPMGCSGSGGGCFFGGCRALKGAFRMSSDWSVVVRGQRRVVCFRAGMLAVCESWFRIVEEWIRTFMM